MTSREFIQKVFNGELGRLDAYNISLELTEREVLKIEMLIIEIDEFCKLKTLGFENAFKWRIDRAMPNPTNYDRGAILRAGFNESEIPDIDDRVYSVLSDPSNKDLFEDENLDYEKLFYPDLCKSLYQLKTDLSDFLESQNEVPTTEKKKSKEVWGLAARYNFLDDLGFFNKIQYTDDQTLRATFISQVLGCSFDNAKKLKNGKYQAGETNEELMERRQLLKRIKQINVDTKG